MKGKRASKEHLTKLNKNSSLQNEMAHPESSRMNKDPHFSETSEFGRLRKFWKLQKTKVTLTVYKGTRNQIGIRYIIC